MTRDIPYFPASRITTDDFLGEDLRHDDSLFHATSSINFDSILGYGGKLVSSKRLTEDGVVLLSGNAYFEGRPDIADVVSTTISWEKAADFKKNFVFDIGKTRALLELCEEYFPMKSIPEVIEFGSKSYGLGFFLDPTAADYKDYSISRIHPDATVGKCIIMTWKVMKNLKQQIAHYDSLDEEGKRNVDCAFGVIFGFEKYDFPQRIYREENSDKEVAIPGEIDLKEKLTHAYADEDNIGEVREFLGRLEPEREVKVFSVQEMGEFLKGFERTREKGYLDQMTQK